MSRALKTGQELPKEEGQGASRLVETVRTCQEQVNRKMPGIAEGLGVFVA